MDEQEIEREQIEAVFALGGGELADESWAGFAHWYDGAPAYADEHRDYSGDFEYRTAIVCELFGQVDTPKGWERVRAFLSSGETECPWRGVDLDVGECCPLCDTEITPLPGENGGLHPEEGHVYLGDGYQEVVFRRPLYRPCEECGGSGRVAADDDVRLSGRLDSCEDCNGDGRIYIEYEEG